MSLGSARACPAFVVGKPSKISLGKRNLLKYPRSNLHMVDVRGRIVESRDGVQCTALPEEPEEISSSGSSASAMPSSEQTRNAVIEGSASIKVRF
jgi:hypothetical protein